mmetsp:Transcript_7928/g.24489  ORF Transcript_7928/g.24489 Transcript_7928/m.24489 type:complete len:376 (+) Transcript_7928:1051-2178(+)
MRRSPASTTSCSVERPSSASTLSSVAPCNSRSSTRSGLAGASAVEWRAIARSRAPSSCGPEEGVAPSTVHSRIHARSAYLRRMKVSRSWRDASGDSSGVGSSALTPPSHRRAAASLPDASTNAVNSASHLSSVSERTLLMCVPMLRCTPLHSRQTRIQRLILAQSGSGAPQSAQRRLASTRRRMLSARCWSTAELARRSLASLELEDAPLAPLPPLALPPSPPPAPPPAEREVLRTPRAVSSVCAFSAEEMLAFSARIQPLRSSCEKARSLIGFFWPGVMISKVCAAWSEAEPADCDADRGVGARGVPPPVAPEPDEEATEEEDEFDAENEDDDADEEAAEEAAEEVPLSSEEQLLSSEESPSACFASRSMSVGK